MLFLSSFLIFSSAAHDEISPRSSHGLTAPGAQRIGRQWPSLLGPQGPAAGAAQLSGLGVHPGALRTRVRTDTREPRDAPESFLKDPSKWSQSLSKDD